MNAPHKIDISKGKNVGTVSAQWSSRPDDQKFLDLQSLHDQVADWAHLSDAYDVDAAKFEAIEQDGKLLIAHPSLDSNMGPSHYGFSDLARIAGAPATYLRTLPAGLAAKCLNEGFSASDNKDRQVQVYRGETMGSSGGDLMRCITSTKYGRILDRDVVAEVMKMVGSGNGDSKWKVPGVMNWSDMTYNPNVDVTKDNTTLYASDRDIFLFLVDDLNPIEVGKLPGGEPDLMFRGFYVWNSEVGNRTFGVATMYLRGVCMNRNLWGVEGFSETTFRHTAGAPARFMEEVAPALLSYSETSSGKLIEGVNAAKAAKVATDNDERIAFLAKLGFSKRGAVDIITTAIVEEQRPPESIWDMAQAITATARKAAHQDARILLETKAGKLLDTIKV
jgi:hypothetical protein